MQLTENSNTDQNPLSADDVIIVPTPGIELPAPPIKRNQHLTVSDPKNKQLTGRCTESEHAKLTAVMAANGCADIVRLMLFSLNLHDNDFFTSFKTK